MLVLFSITMASAQDVCYYKLTKKKENGTICTNVSGGQFITFRGDVCYESNKNGVGVDHGTMQRNENYSKSQYLVYQRKSGAGCFWGKDATFKFTSDKSKLNVVLENGDVYAYERASAPAGQETCSLIRKPSSGGNTGGTVVGGITPPPVYPIEPYNPTPIQPDNSNTGTTQQKPRHEWWHYEWHEVTEDCYMCHGSGKCSSCNGTHSIWNEFGGGKIECPNCRPDGRCTTCGGRGKITKQKLY